MPLPHALRAFRHRDYRLYFAGQGVSQIGTWLQLIATSWLIYQMTHSAFMLGLAAFALHIPLLVLGPFAGVWVDRKHKRKVLLVTQNLALVQSLILLGVVATDTVQPWHLIAANLWFGIVNSFDNPARQSQLVELVGGRADLPNAIALSSTLMNGARFVGPMIGGAVISAFGEAWSFGLNATLRFAVIIALVLIRAAPRPTEKGSHSWLQQLSEGFRYAFGFLPSRAALLMLAAVSISVQPYQSLAPYFARDVFHGDSRTLGFLIGAGGLGAVSGMVYLATRSTVRGLLRMLPISGGAAGLALIGFSFAPSLWIGLVMLYFVGMGAMLTGAATNTVLQSIVEDRMRARVMAIYMACFFGMSPIGAFIAGSLAEKIGPPATLAGGGVLAVVAAIIYMANLSAIRDAIRPIYQKLGIVPGPEQ